MTIENRKWLQQGTCNKIPTWEFINQSGCCCCCGCVFVFLKVKRNKIKNSNDRQGIATDTASVCKCSLPVWMKNVNENSVFKAFKGRTLFGRKTKSMLNRGHEDTDSEKNAHSALSGLKIIPCVPSLICHHWTTLTVLVE